MGEAALAGESLARMRAAEDTITDMNHQIANASEELAQLALRMQQLAGHFRT